MEKQDEIISRIAQDAAIYAEKTVNSAKELAKANIAQADKNADVIIDEAKKLAEENGKILLSQRATLAELEVKKSALSARKRAIDSVFDNALSLLCSLDKAKYLAYVEKLINSFAESSDNIILSEKAPFSEKEAAELKVARDKKLTFKKNGKFKGGIMIVGNGADINLSFEAIIDEQKELLEKQVFNALFN